MSLPAILAAATSLAGGFAATIPPDWMQGRTSYGGLSAALALEAARGAGEDLPPLRSAQVSFIGPLAGAVTVTARLLRRGRNAAWVGAEVHCEHGLGLAATFVFMGPVASALHLDDSPPPPGRIAPADARPLPPGGGPAFLTHFEARFAMPRAGEPMPEIAWWLRLKDRTALDPMVEVLLVADALPPGVMPLVRRAPVSSMTWLINLLTPAPVSDEGWWLLRSRGSYAEQGCSSQAMGVWNATGAPIATGMQSIAVFG
ncbi:MAG: thioesterase family protein [Novosphingobium sp.]